MNTTKKDSLVSQDPFFLAALKKLPDPLQVALRDSDVDDPGLLTAFPVLSVAELGLETTQGTARRRRIGKRKGPGDHEPQRFDIGDIILLSSPLFFSPALSWATFFSFCHQNVPDRSRPHRVWWEKRRSRRGAAEHERRGNG